MVAEAYSPGKQFPGRRVCPSAGKPRPVNKGAEHGLRKELLHADVTYHGYTWCRNAVAAAGRGRVRVAPAAFAAHMRARVERAQQGVGVDWNALLSYYTGM